MGNSKELFEPFDVVLLSFNLVFELLDTGVFFFNQLLKGFPKAFLKPQQELADSRFRFYFQPSRFLCDNTTPYQICLSVKPLQKGATIFS